jgi:hypothetical protein
MIDDSIIATIEIEFFDHGHPNLMEGCYKPPSQISPAILR